MNAIFLKLTAPIALILTCLLTATHAVAVNGIRIRVVALSGAPAPGDELNQLFDGFFDYAINNRGQVVLYGSTTDPGETGIWSEDGGNELALVAKSGDAAPDAGQGATFGLVSLKDFNDLGQTVFTAAVTGGGMGFRTSLWASGRGNGTELIVQRADDAPGRNRTFTDNLFSPVLNNQGDVAFSADLSGSRFEPIGREGVWLDIEGNGLSPAAITGDPAPSVGENIQLGRFFFNPDVISDRKTAINDQGTTAFFAYILDPEGDTTNDYGLWMAGGDAGLELVAREDGPVTGTSFTFRSFRFFWLNNPGDIAFLATTRNSPVFAQEGLWKRNAGQEQFTLIAREQTSAPGLASNFFIDAIERVALNDAGQTAFTAELRGSGVDETNDRALWIHNEGSEPELIARSGQLIPGGENVRFLDFEIALNNLGRIAFLTELQGAGGGESIWAHDRTGLLREIIRVGDTIDVSNDPSSPDLRTVSRLFFSDTAPFTNQSMTGFNDLGQVAFRAIFDDDSSGVFVSNLVAIPEPATLALLALGMLATTRRLNHRGR